MPLAGPAGPSADAFVRSIALAAGPESDRSSPPATSGANSPQNVSTAAPSTGDAADEDAAHSSWRLDDFSWDGEALLGFAAAPTVASRSGGPRCQVVGCAAPLKGQPRYNARYRICEPHLRAPSADIAGVASRWCQTCSRWQALSAFEGDKRTCIAQLDRLRQRRVAAKAAKAGFPPAAPAPACILFDHDALTAWLMAPPAAAQASPPSCELDDDTFLAGLLGLETPASVRTAAAAALWLEHEQPVAQSFELKLPHAPPPDALPSAPLGAAMRAWAGEPLAMHAVAQPGCVLLTVDALSLYAATTKQIKRLQPADLTAAVRAACAGDAADAAAVRGATAIVADGSSSSGGPRPLLRAAPLAPHAASLQVPLAAAPQDGVLRARAHGSLLRCEALGDADAGSWILNVSLPPPPEAPPTLLLLDVDAAPALYAPTPLLLCASAAVAAELDAALRSLPAADADAAAHLLGAAMHRGGSRAAPELLHAAACFAARNGCVATLETMLPTLLPLHARFRIDLLAAAAGAAQLAAVRLLLARGGAGGAFGDVSSALHAAALAASAADDVALRGAEACEALTARGAGAAAWFALRVRLGSDEAAPAGVAARGSHPATVALCAALRTRRAAARALVADAAAAVAATPRPVEHRLAAMLQLLSGAYAATGGAAAELAWHLVRRAATADAARRADAAERATLCLGEFGGAPGFASVFFNALCMLRIMALPALTPAQLAAAAAAGVQLTWLQYLRLVCVPLMVAHGYALLDSAAGAALRRLAPLPLLRAAHARRHAARACGIAATQVFVLWWSCFAGLPELPRVHAAAAAAQLVVSLQALLIFRRLPPRYCAALCLMRAGVLLYAAAAPGCMLLPRSWLTRVTIAPHIAVFAVDAFRAVNAPAAQGERRDKLE